MEYYLMLIVVVQGTVPPPPEKPLARIRLCVNGKPAIITPNIRLTLGYPNSPTGLPLRWEIVRGRPR